MEKSTFNSILGNESTNHIANFIKEAIRRSEGELSIDNFFASAFIWHDHTVYVYSNNANHQLKIKTFDEDSFESVLNINFVGITCE